MAWATPSCPEPPGRRATTNCPPAERLIELHSGRHAQRVAIVEAIDVDTTSRAASFEAPHDTPRLRTRCALTLPRSRCIDDDDDDDSISESLSAQWARSARPVRAVRPSLTLSAPAYHKRKSSCQSIYSYSRVYKASYRYARTTVTKRCQRQSSSRTMSKVTYISIKCSPEKKLSLH